MQDAIALHVTVKGRVQGVWYRGWTAEQAELRHLEGWVRNRSDGSVEAVFCGPAALVHDMIAACRRGPPAALVTDVLISETAAQDFGGFQRLPTL